MADKHEYEIDDLFKMLLADDSWEPDPGLRMATVQGMHVTYVGCPLNLD